MGGVHADDIIQAICIPYNTIINQEQSTIDITYLPPVETWHNLSATQTNDPSSKKSKRKKNVIEIFMKILVEN